MLTLCYVKRKSHQLPLSHPLSCAWVYATNNRQFALGTFLSIPKLFIFVRFILNFFSLVLKTLEAKYMHVI